jgi:hypothetical protein
MYITTNTYNNEIDTPISLADTKATYLQIFEKRFELGLVDSQGFAIMQKNSIDGSWQTRAPWAFEITPEVASIELADGSGYADDFAATTEYQAQRRAWNTQESAQAYVDFINQLNSPAWSATYDGFDESIQNDGSSLL